jgi:hypothetical protein
VHGGAVRSDQLGLLAHAVSLAGAIGRPLLSVTCLNLPRCSSRRCLLCSAFRTQAGRRAESEMCHKRTSGNFPEAESGFAKGT